MIIVDVEATGTDPRVHSLLSVGAIDLDNPKRVFYEECRMREGAHVMREALEVNGFKESELNDPNKKTDREVVEDFLLFIKGSQDQTIAGQNVSFDRDCIKYSAEFYHLNCDISYRTVDLHSVAMTHMLGRGVKIPVEKKHSGLDSDKIFKYVGIPTEPKPHIAINGAKYEAEAFSRLFYNKKLLPQFEKFEIPWQK